MCSCINSGEYNIIARFHIEVVIGLPITCDKGHIDSYPSEFAFSIIQLCNQEDVCVSACPSVWVCGHRQILYYIWTIWHQKMEDSPSDIIQNMAIATHTHRHTYTSSHTHCQCTSSHTQPPLRILTHTLTHAHTHTHTCQSLGMGSTHTHMPITTHGKHNTHTHTHANH